MTCIPGDYEGALGILTEMTYFAHERATPVSSSNSQPIGAYADVLSSCEILRVLLLLLLQVSSNFVDYFYSKSVVGGSLMRLRLLGFI